MQLESKERKDPQIQVTENQTKENVYNHMQRYVDHIQLHTGYNTRPHSLRLAAQGQEYEPSKTLRTKKKQQVNHASLQSTPRKPG